MKTDLSLEALLGVLPCRPAVYHAIYGDASVGPVGSTPGVVPASQIACEETGDLAAPPELHGSDSTDGSGGGHKVSKFSNAAPHRKRRAKTALADVDSRLLEGVDDDAGCDLAFVQTRPAARRRGPQCADVQSHTSVMLATLPMMSASGDCDNVTPAEGRLSDELRLSPPLRASSVLSPAHELLSTSPVAPFPF